MKLFYVASKYRSHARAAAAYKSLLADLVELVNTPEEADVVVLHDEPHTYPTYFKNDKCLAGKYTIGYAVWEASGLPSAYVAGLALVQEVWTCSEYCAETFKQSHRKVFKIPHVADRRDSSTSQDRAYVASLLPFDANYVTFLTVLRLWDRRKNIEGLLRAFLSTSQDMPRARLVIKCDDPQDYTKLRKLDERIIPIVGELSEGQMCALYLRANAFVSAHKAEGWGLCISDAMSLGCLIVATDYSGPRDYVTAENSILLTYDLVNISQGDQYGFFDRSMQWAEPRLTAIDDALRLIYDDPYTKDLQDKRRAARLVSFIFSREKVAEILKARLREMNAVLGISTVQTSIDSSEVQYGNL